jgi:ribosomal-protein-alanine N-acetyltransferase
MTPPSPELATPRLRLRLLAEPDLPLLQRYRTENRAHLAPWEPEREEAYYGAAACATHIAYAQASARGDRGYLLAAFDRAGTEMIASVSFNNVVRGVFQACHLGYGIAAKHQGRGLMREALEASLAWAFGELGLHRVMANYMPRNERSGRLLAALGFEREGYARQYLRIAGRWEDHVLTAKIAS